MEFAERIKTHLHSMFESSGFVKIDETTETLEYANAEKGITVRIGRDTVRGNELFLYITRGGWSCDLLELIEFFRYPQERIPFAVSSTDDSDQVLKAVEELLSSSEYALLKGDAKCYASILEFQRTKAAKDKEQMEIESLLSTAQRAWDDKDYAAIVNLLSTQSRRLPEIWKGRLQYSNRKVRRRGFD